jgi:predicted transcriptional regulator
MTRQTAATIAMSTAITEHLQSNPEQTTAEITSALKADPGTIGSAMQRLFKAGRVKKI